MVSLAADSEIFSRAVQGASSPARTAAEGHDVGPLLQHRLDGVLVQIVREHDAAIGKPRLIQHAPGHLREPRQVARVDADAGQALAALAHFQAHGDGVPDALLHIVGIHQKDAVVREDAGVLAEGGKLVIEGHDPRMGVSARDRDVEELAGQHVRG